MYLLWFWFYDSQVKTALTGVTGKIVMKRKSRITGVTRMTRMTGMTRGTRMTELIRMTGMTRVAGMNGLR